MSRGVTVWFTGLSGAGKTTIARRVEELLQQEGVPVERLDGDTVRQTLTRDLGFSREDRNRNIERVLFVAKLLTRHGVVVLASFISPYEEMRETCRREIGSFLEVYVKASLPTLLARDVKGLYRKALAGELKNFTGVDDPYEEPTHPELVLETDERSVEECAQEVLDLLRRGGYLHARPRPGYPAPLGAPGQEASWPGGIAPHGGRLVDRELPPGERTHARQRARELFALRLGERELADLELLGVGAFSPLTGFMGERDYRSVVEHMRLADGLVWTLPVTLSVTAEEARALREGQEVALLDGAGQPVGLLQVQEVFAYDKDVEAELVFGTRDPAHPGVARLYQQGDYLVGGSVWVIERPGKAFAHYRYTPLRTRQLFHERGWRRVVAFQTRNPVHRAHEYLQKVALEVVDGLLLHPLMGATKADDVPPEVRLKTYEAILAAYYPQERVLLGVFPAAMRYAGPREAVFHALCRKNYGCTHFIVGRDHAGVGNFYGTYDAQEIFRRFAPEEIGIEPLLFENAFYCTVCGGMATAKTCPHGDDQHVSLSGTKVRALLRRGELPPPEYSRPEVATILAEALAEPRSPAGPAR